MALHAEQARDELQAVHDAVVDLLFHELGPHGGMPRGNAKLHLVHDKGGQVFKIVDLILANGVRLLIDHAQSSQSEPVAGGQRNARIEAPAEFTGNKRIGKGRTEEHTSELQSLMSISYSV